MFYKNVSNYTKTFYGITFKPGHIDEVSGYINDSDFVRVTEEDFKAQTKEVKHKTVKNDTVETTSAANTKSAE